MRNSVRVVLAALWMGLALSSFAAVNVASFSPGYGAVGDVVMIYGSGFYPGTLTVKFNGVQDPTAQATAADGTVIQAAVPAGATTGPITVKVNNSSGSSLTNFIIIGPGPYVQSFDPYSGAAGSTLVRITGKRFYYPTPVTQVTFDGKNASSVYIESDTVIQAYPPASATTGPIKVTTALGSYQTSTNFFITPSVSTLTPTAGRTSTNVVITGQNFLGTLSVQFNGADAPGFTVLSNQAVRVPAPAGVTKGKIRVNTPAGSAETAADFVVPPTIFGFAPNFGPENTSVVITGANFNLGTPSIKFNGVPAATPTSVTFGQLTAKVPAGATTGPITITTTDGSHQSIMLFYLPPSITGITPTTGGAGASVRITGQNLTNATAVNFGAQAALNFTVSNNTAIYATAPADVSSGKISVTTPGGTATSAAGFYVAPVITTFAPTHGLPGTNVAIYGKNFLDASALEFNGTPAVFTVSSNEFISATVPNGAQTGPLTIRAPGGTNTTTIPFVLDYASDLQVTATDAPDPVWLGSNLVYTLIITNKGPYDAPNVRLTTQLPANAVLKGIYSSKAGTTWTTNGGTLTATIGPILKSQWVTVALTVVPMQAGIATFVGSVVSDYNDPVPANNTATLETLVRPLPLLNIQLVSTNRVRLLWPEVLSNYVLQYRPDLNTNTYWSNVQTAPVILEGERTVTERATNGVRFYRLKDGS